MSKEAGDLAALWAQTIPAGISDPGLATSATYRPSDAKQLSDLRTVATDLHGATIRSARAGQAAPAARPGAGAPEPAGSLAQSFDLLDEIGRGGMGVVFRARQRSLERDVAIKKMIPERLSEEAKLRFLTEGRVTGFLDHPNVVPVHALGQDEDGAVFMAMKLVGGREWSRALRDDRPGGPSAPDPAAATAQEGAPTALHAHDSVEGHDTVEDAAVPSASLASAPTLQPRTGTLRVPLGAVDAGDPLPEGAPPFGPALPEDAMAHHLEVLDQVANAVAFAHTRGICHLDLKPENVMVGDFGEVLVMDWGLAVDVSEHPADDSRTLHRSSVTSPCGTPAYMPPELVEGRGDDVGPWTDVYLLGAILYEIATGRPPHQRKRFLDTLLAAQESEPPPFPAGVSEELRAICRRALSREEKDRYPTVAAFQQALTGYRRHRESHRIAERAARRLAAVPGVHETDAGATQSRAMLARNDIYAELLSAIAGFAEAAALWEGNVTAIDGERLARVQLVETAIHWGDLGLASSQVERLPAGPNRDRLAGRVAKDTEDRARAARNIRRLRNGLLAATLVIGLGLTLGLWLVNGARRAAERSEQRAVASAEQARAAYHTAERRLAESLVAEADTLQETGRFEEARRRLVDARATLTRLGSEARRVDLATLALDQAAPPPLHDVVAHEGPITGVWFAPDGDRLVTAGEDGAVRLWDTDTCAPLAALPAGDAVLGLAGALETPRFAVVRRSGVTVWALRPDAFELVTTAPAAPGASPRAAALSRLGARLLVGDTGGGLRLYDGASGKLENEFVEADGLRAIAFAGSEDFAVTGHDDGNVKVWHMGREDPRNVQRIHEGPVRSVAFSSRGYVASAGSDRLLGLWHFTARRGEDELQRLPGLTTAARAVTFEHDGQGVLIASRGGTVQRFAIPGGEPGTKAEVGARFGAPPGAAEVIAVSVDRHGLALGGADGRLRLLPVEGGFPAGTVLTRRAANPAGVDAVALLGDRAATPGPAGHLAIWDVEALRVLREVSVSAEPVTAIAVDEAAARFVAGTADGRVLWVSREGDVEGEVRVDAGVVALAASAGGIVVGTASGALALVSPDSRHVTPLGATADPIAGLAVEGTRLWVASGTALSSLDLSEGPGAKLRPALDLNEAIRSIYAGSGEVVVGDALGVVHRIRDGRVVDRTEVHDGIASAIAEAGGRDLVTGGADGRLRLVRARSASGGTIELPFPAGDTPAALAARGDTVLVGTRGGELVRIDLGYAGEAARLAAARTTARARLAAGDATALPDLARWAHFRGARAAAIRLWARAEAAGVTVDPAQAARARWERGDLWGALEAARRSPSASRLVPALERALDENESRLGQEEAIISSVSTSADGRFALVTTNPLGTAVVYDLRSGLRSRTHFEHTRPIYSAAIAGDLAVTADTGGAIHTFELATGEVRRRLKAPPKMGVTDVCVLAGGRIAAAGGATKLMIWDLGEPEPAREIETERHIRAIAAAPDRDELAVASGTRVIELFEGATGKRLRSIERNDDSPSVLRYIAGGRKLLAAGGRAVEIYDLAGDEPVVKIRTGQSSIYGAAITPDHRLLATTSSDGTVVYTEIASGFAVSMHSVPRTLLPAAMAPDGRTLIVGARDGSVLRFRVPELPK